MSEAGGSGPEDVGGLTDKAKQVFLKHYQSFRNPRDNTSRSDVCNWGPGNKGKETGA